MQRERYLAGGAVAILLVTLLAAALVPGALSEPRPDVTPSNLDLREDASTIRVVSVPGDTVTFQFETRVLNRGATAGNVSVEVRAIDADSGLLVDRESQNVGSMGPLAARTLRTNLTVPREGGYDIETVVSNEGRQVELGRRSITGVGQLTPDYADSTVAFQSFTEHDAGFGAIAVQVQSTSGDDVRLGTNVFVQNTGSSPSDAVTLRVRARQADSNLIADDTTTTVGTLQPGSTRTVETTLSVPDDYNYWIDGILLDGDVVVATTTAPANLAPNETLGPSDEGGESGDGFDAGDFARGTPADGAPGGRPTSTPGSGPGFGAVIALFALLGGTLLLVRRHAND